MNNKGIDAGKQRDYICFLEQILKICVILKDKIGAGVKTKAGTLREPVYINKKIFFRARGVNGRWYEIWEEGWINSLFCCVYDAVMSEERALEISLSEDGAGGEFIELEADFNITPDREMMEERDNLAEIKIRGVLDRLQNGFVDNSVIERLRRDSDDFFSARNRLRAQKSVFHIRKSEIKEYLKKYYSLLLDFIIFYDIFAQERDRDICIGELLRLDASFDEKSGGYQLNFWAPVILNKLQKINDGIEVFFQQITENEAVESKWMEEIYQHTLLTKAQHSLRWYISGEDRRLLHAAIAPYVDDTPDSLRFHIAVHSLQTYSSYEGIGELRLGEKIVYEYEMAEKSGLSQYCVAIIGDLHAGPVEELYRYVEKKTGGADERLPIRFNIYTKREFGGIKNINIQYRGLPGDVLLDRDELERVIDTNSVVFILDCVELYKSPMVRREDAGFIKQKYAFSAYDEYNTGSAKKADICDQNMLEELYEVLTCEQCFNQFGRLSKQANSFLLEFCEEKQRERGKASTIYIYVSDMKAFDKIYKDDQYYIRTERYNQKEIGIIRYSSEEVTKLDVGGNNKVLVFNIWQFIKIVALSERNMFISFVNESEDAYTDLDQIYVGVDYKDWPKLLVVHYYSPESRYDQVALRFINDVLLPVFNNRSRDMFRAYIRKSMYSFLYSSAKNVNDMLFIHLFEDKENLLGEAVLAEKNNGEEVKAHINRKFKYSSKRFYDMIMKNYDISSNIYIGQARTYHTIRKNESNDGKINKDEIYENVIAACKNLSYGNGYLVKNCEKELR